MNKSFTCKPLSLCVCLAMTATAASVVANESEAEKLKQIEKVEVTGQRILGVDVVDLNDIRKKQANDLEDIFSGEPAITVGGSFGIAQKVYVRGIEDTNLNVSVDGATQAGYLFHHQGRLSIEPEMLKHVEVKAGTGTALDGPGAIGGAIRFETKDADDLLESGERFGSLIKAGYFSNTKGKRLSGSFFGRLNDQWSGLAILGKNDTDNIKTGRGDELDNTKTDQDLGLLKLTGQLTDEHKITLSHEIRNDDGYRNVRPHFYAAGWNSANQQKSRRETSTLGYHYQPGSNLVDLSVTAYKTDSYLTQNEGTDRMDGAGVKSSGFDIRNTTTLRHHTLTYGIDQRSDTGYYINGRGNDEKGDVVGIYLQDTYQASAALSLSMGARYDDYQLDDADGQSYSATGLSPNLSAIYKFNDQWSVRGGYSQAIRGQKVKEAYLIGYRSNAADLKEEEASNLDLTLTYDADDVHLSAQVFDTRVDDVVATVRTEQGRFFANAGELKTSGYTLSAAKNWDNAGLSINYSHVKPELDGAPLDDTSMGVGTAFGDTLTVNSNYVLDQLNLELGWNARFVKALTDVPSTHPDKPGYGVHDMYVEWSAMADDQLIVNLSVNNVFDKYYFDHGTFGYDTDEMENIGLPEPGRDVRLTVSYKF